MGNIVLLDDLTINKIAAGEVIERPASVVKELVENSIDAGATNINIEIKNGGISYIRVTDNGKGIMPDDLEIAFERHATSKIRKAEDLELVKSMGFRGEALASIAAIARITMKSKAVDSYAGYEVIVEGGNVISKQEAGCSQGTSITVENLFYNTPVRYKFLKKDFTEAGYIEDTITRIALVNPDIAIKFVSSGKTIIQTNGNGDLKQVVYSIYGKDIAENILDVNYEYDDIKVLGVVGKPVVARSNRSNQLFFVNKRYIKDKTLTAGAEQAFKGMITIGKFGFVILDLEINPAKVDVNVHPTKSEVRFEEESKIFKAVYHAIKDTLLKGDLVSNPERSFEKMEETKIVSETEKDIVSESNKDNVEKNETVEENNGGLFRNKDVEPRNAIEEIYNQRNNLMYKKIPVNSYESILEQMGKMQEAVNEFKHSGDFKEKETDYTANPTEDNVNNNIDDSQKNQNEENIDEDIKVIYREKIKKEVNTENTDISGETIVLNTLNEIDDIKEQATQIINMDEIIEKSKELEEIKMEHGEDFDEMYNSVFGKMPVKEKEPELPDETNVIEDAHITKGEAISIFDDEENKKYIPKYKFIGIVFSTYIIIELDKEMYIIDQHAAHERIMYERVKKNYYNEEEKDSQIMLLPDVITLTHKEMDIALENMDMFRKAGFTLEEFGENTIKLIGVPNVCIELDTKELFLETLDEINSVARTAKQEKEEKFIATVACKAAVKANMALNEQEVDSLMEKLLVLPNPFTCPHGRPTAIRMNKNDIEKKFERRK